MRSPITHPRTELVAGLIFVAIAIFLGPSRNDRNTLLGQLPDGIVMWILVACGVFFVARGIIGLVAKGRAKR